MNWPEDIKCMHDRFGFTDSVKPMNEAKRKQFLVFRLRMCQEELDETLRAMRQTGARDLAREDIVDGLIDLCVFAIGTLDLFDIDVTKAWEEVLKANMCKTPGIKKERYNPFNLADLVKPAGWKPPSHTGNTGDLP